MPGLVPAIHDFVMAAKTWMPATSAGITILPSYIGYSANNPTEDRPMAVSNECARVHIDVVSDVVCPWCYIGKHRLEHALTLTPQTAAEVEYRPYFLNPWIPHRPQDLSRD